MGGGWGCHKFVPVFGGDNTEIVPAGDLFDQPPDEMSSIRGKLADHVGDHVVLPSEGVVLVTSLGTELSYSRPLQSLKHSKYMAALNYTIASVPAREYVFVLTGAKARTGKRGEGGGELDSKVLGAYGRDKLNENGKLLLGFAKDNKLALLNTFFCTPQNGVSYTFQSANRSKGQARLDYILAKQADRRLIRCVNVRRPPLEAPESDPNLVYAKVRIPRRSAPNRRKRDSTKEIPKLADFRRLMTDPNLRCQVANAMVDTLPPIPDGTCIGDIATDMADVMLSTAAELVPRSKRPRGAQGGCAGPGVEAEMNAAWQQREDARRHLRAEPHNSNLRKVVKMAGKKPSEGAQGCRAELLLRLRSQTRNTHSRRRPGWLLRAP